MLAGERVTDTTRRQARELLAAPGLQEPFVIVPTRSEFHALAKTGKLVPVYREVFADHDTPVSAFRKIDDGPYGFLLESVEGGEKWGRSPARSWPSPAFIARGETSEMIAGGVVTKGTRHPLRNWPRFWPSTTGRGAARTPRFCGGAVGYLSYDSVRWFEKLPQVAKDELHVPDAVFMFGDVVSVFDNLTHTMKVVTHARGGDDPNAAYDAAVARLNAEVGSACASRSRGWSRRRGARRANPSRA